MSIWQTTENCYWYTDEPLICSWCGKKHTKMTELVCEETGATARFCFLHPKRMCFRHGFEKFFKDNDVPEDGAVLFRGIEFVVPETKKREPIGLALRYWVMKRDKFKCVRCGKTAEHSSLEIDHIVPISSGGRTVKENLRTLCFECNRGKRDSLEG